MTGRQDGPGSLYPGEGTKRGDSRRARLPVTDVRRRGPDAAPGVAGGASSVFADPLGRDQRDGRWEYSAPSPSVTID